MRAVGKCPFTTLPPAHFRAMPGKPRPACGLHYRLDLLFLQDPDRRHCRRDRVRHLRGVLVPAVPHWIWVLGVVLIICAINLMTSGVRRGWV